MFHFFNDRSNAQATVQVANCIALSLAAYNAFYNPETLWEEGFDIAMLAFNVLCFSRNDNQLSRILNIGLNFSSFGVIYAAIASGTTGRSLIANTADLALHFTNLFASIDWDRKQSSTTLPMPS